MSRIKINVFFKSNGISSQKTYPAIKQDHCLLYHDESCQVMITEDCMIRDNEEYHMVIDMKKSIIHMLDKKTNLEFTLDIIIKEYQHEKTQLKFYYQLQEDMIMYEYKEVTYDH